MEAHGPLHMLLAVSGKLCSHSTLLMLLSRRVVEALKVLGGGTGFFPTNGSYIRSVSLQIIS